MNDRSLHAVIAGFIVTGTFGAVHAAAFEQRFAQAQSAFRAAQETAQRVGSDTIESRQAFRAAAEQFAAIYRDGGRSASVCVNAGNSWYFAGDGPQALLWYLRGVRLANTPDTRNGVAALRRVCGAELWPPPSGSIGRALMFWHYDLARRTKQRLLLAVYPLGCVLLAAAVFVRPRRTLMRLGIVLMVVGLCVGISDVVAAASPGERWAVVMEGTKGHAGDGEAYTVTVSAIRPGQEVKVLESRPQWLRVGLPGGTACWVRAETCEEV